MNKETKQFEGAWEAEDQVWRNRCLELSKDLTSFKRDGIYNRKIANDVRPENIAVMFFNYIKSTYPDLYEKLDTFSTNDTIGQPNIYNIEGNNVSPGTLRFIKVLGDIIDLNPKSIVEIGSGYGGQCKIIKDYLSLDYTLVDIPESLTLAKSYLNHFNIEANFMDTNNIQNGNYDLVISDYCLSELDNDGITFYVNNIIKNCKYGYFTINDSSPQKDHLINELTEVFDKVNINTEQPNSSSNINLLVTCKKESN